VDKDAVWIGTPEEAEELDRARYAAMTPQERLNAMIELNNRWGKWNERRLERIFEFIEVPRG
jgi:hypothetical protein